MAYKRQFFRVNKGSIVYKGRTFSEGAEFPGAEKDMDDWRAEGVVSVVTSQRIVYASRQTGLGGVKTSRAQRPMRVMDTLAVLTHSDLYYIKRDERVITQFRQMYPEYTRGQVMRMKRRDFTQMVIEKRGF
jgi:hypothetical protein